jgi:hypothetical protein
MVNSPKGVLGGGGDQSSACDGGLLALILGDGWSSRWGLSNHKKHSNDSLVTNSIFS